MHLLILDSTESITFPRPDLALTSGWQVTHCSSFAESENQLDQVPLSPDLILVYQDRPKQLTQASVLRLLSCRPLLRVIQVLGPWCDGDLRTPGRLSGVMTITFREAPLRLGEILEAFSRGVGVLTRPLTAFELAPPLPPPSSTPLRIGVDAPNQLASSVSTSLSALGHEPFQLAGGSSTPTDLDAIIVDGDAHPSSAPAVSHPKILALLGFSRDEVQPSLPKSFTLGDLESAIQKLVHSNRGLLEFPAEHG